MARRRVGASFCAVRQGPREHNHREIKCMLSDLREFPGNETGEALHLILEVRTPTQK